MLRRRALLTDYEAQTWFEYEGVKYPSFSSFRVKGTDATFNDITTFQSRNTDIIICNYPKSGTHWLKEIISLLIAQDVRLTEASVGQTMLEYIVDLATLIDLPPPRLFTTHLSFKYLPKQHMTLGGKVIHLIRNPKDVCVSAYNHFRKDVMVDLDITWDEFVNLWIDGKLPYTTWYEHIRDYSLAKLRYPDLVHLVYYEDIIKNHFEEIKRLAHFLDIPCTDPLAEGISYVTMFDYMKSNKRDMSTNLTVDGKPFVYRKGKIGDWKNWFTVSQNEKFDDQYEREMTDAKYRIVFQP